VNVDGQITSLAAELTEVAVDARRKQARVDGRVVRLSPTETRLLALLVERTGRCVPSGALAVALHPDAPEAAARVRLRSDVRRLRQRLEVAPERPRIVLGARGTGGYQLHASVVAPPTAPLTAGGSGLAPELTRQLAPLERRLLAALERAPGRFAEWRVLARAIGASESPDLNDRRRLKVYVNRLRARIEADPTRPQRLITLRGAGYALV
jgi:DNA-binding response OmpR family regulator